MWLMRKRGLILIITFLAIMSLFPLSRAQEERVELIEVTVKKGDTLHKFAEIYLRDPSLWPEIHKYNKALVKDPNLILPAMKIKVPVGLLKDEIADIIHIRNNVRTRKRGESEWEKAVLYMRLFSEDGVRTLSDSLARIKFIKGEILRLSENSLIILKPEEKEETVELLSGELRASEAKVLTASAVVEPQISPALAKPDFKTKIKKDKTTLVSVYKGKVDLIAQGERVTIPEGFMSQAKLDYAPEKPIALPPPPDLSEAKEELAKKPGAPELAEEKVLEEKINLEETLTGLDFSEKKRRLGIKYLHLQVASDPKFMDVIEDKRLESIEKYQRSRLPDGEYFWRISYVYEDEFESEYSPVRSFTVVTIPPGLEVSSPREGEEIPDEFIKVKGRTDEGCTVRVNDKRVYVNKEGDFFEVVYLALGKNIITVQSEDKKGNVAIVKRKVEVVPPKKRGFWGGTGIVITIGLMAIILVSLL
ncbi:MAG: FecR domain-containing protein [bacterium]